MEPHINEFQLFLFSVMLQFTISKLHLISLHNNFHYRLKCIRMRSRNNNNIALVPG